MTTTTGDGRAFYRCPTCPKTYGPTTHADAAAWAVEHVCREAS